MIRISSINAEVALASMADLVAMLADAVETGASVGFLAPLDVELARAYWQRVAREVSDGTRLLIGAWDEAGLVGSVQLAFAVQENARHRGEVQRLIVHSRAQRRGIGRALMIELEKQAHAHGRSLLFLNTRAGDPPERLYLSLGWCRVGTIPDFARSPDGTFNTTTIMYRLLEHEQVHER
jgi:ribosomal protein S18 acetylase RimI-like enzyme